MSDEGQDRWEELPEPTTLEKHCNACERTLPHTAFHRRSDAPHVLRSLCIECERERHRQEYQARRAALDPANMNPPGRPTRDTAEVREIISAELAAGKMLTQVIRENPEMPAYTTLMRWWLGQPGDGHDVFRSMLAQARQAQIEKWLEDAMAEVQDPRDDWVWHDKRQEFVPDKYAPMRLKELLQHTRWMAERVLPTLYGSRVQVDHSHRSGDHATSRIDWSQLDADTIRRVRAAMVHEEPDADHATRDPEPRLVGEGSSSGEPET